MAFSPGTGQKTNFLASLRRTMQYGWWGAVDEATQFGQPPTLLNGEFITQINPANTGVINLLGADVNGQLAFPAQVSIALTSAQILALNATPVALIAAPGAGFAIVLNSIIISMTRTATAYAAGSTVAPVYHGATTPLVAAAFPIALFTTGGAGIETRLATPVAASTLAATANTGVDLIATGSAFTTGTGTAKVYVSYTIVAL